MEYYPVGEKGNKTVLLGFQNSNVVIPAGSGRHMTQMEGALNESDFNDNDALGRELQKLHARSSSVDVDSGFPATTN
jgi:hypothetical protein